MTHAIFKSTKVALLSGAAIALSACGGGSDTTEQTKSAPATGDIMAGIDTSTTEPITKANLTRRISKLADDEFAGRAPADEAGEKAAAWIAGEMKRMGLEPLPGNNNFFQPVTLVSTTVQPGSYLNITNRDGEVSELDDILTEAVFWTKKIADEVSYEDSELVFVGYGTVAPEHNWDDYAGQEWDGKTVVMLVNDPGYAKPDSDMFNGKSMTYYGRWTYKFEEAGRQGADGAIIIHETAPASYGWDVVSGSWTGAQIDLERPDGGASRTMLEGWVTVETAKDLFNQAGLNFEDLKAAAAEPGFEPVTMDGLTASAKIINAQSKVRSRNVAGMVKGAVHPDEYVLYMAHWDHLGQKDVAEGEDGIYNGAVDNATGTAAILEIGEAFAGRETPPDRSIIILAVTAEESGLLGSAYFAEDPLVPLNKIVAGINLDGMLPVGLTKDMIVVGYGASELEDRLAAIVEPRGMYLTPDPKPEAGYFYRSDHISLAKKGVPMLYADAGVDHRTKGPAYGEQMGEDYTENHYHQVSDEFSEDWDLRGIVETAQIMYELGLQISNTEEWPNWYEGNEFRSLRDEMLK